MPIESHRLPTPPAPSAAAATRWSWPATVSTAPRACSTGWSARTRPSAAPAATRGGTRSGPASSASRAAANGVSSWMSHSAVRPSIERSANRPAPSPWQTSSGRQSHCRPRRSRPASSRHQSSLKKVATAADRQPGARGQQRGERRVEAGRLAAAPGVVPGEQPGDRRPVGVDERPGLGDRAEPDRAHPHVAGDPHEVGQQPVDGGDGIHGVALAPLRARSLPRRRERGAGDHLAGAVERHRLGHGGAEIDADVDGRGHVLRNLGTPGPDRSTDRSRERRAISVPGRRACIVPGRRTASPGPPCTTRPGGGIGRRASLRC